MNNVTFLFGAGAEAKNNFELPSGDEYVKETIKNPDKRFLEIIKKQFNFLDTKTIYDDEMLNIKIIRLLANRLCDETKQKYCGIMKFIQSDKHFIKCDGKQVIKGSRDKLVSDIVNKRFDQTKSKFLKALKIENDSHFYSVYLDSLFNSFACEKHKDGSKVSEQYKYLVYYYWLCYYCIFKRVFYSVKGYKYKLTDNFIDESRLIQKEFYDERVIGKLRSNYSDSYYSLINRYLAKHKRFTKLRGIATSNYFQYCKLVSRKCDIAYLNGNLRMFEEPANLRVYNRNICKDKNDIFIPFLLGISYVKPIICSYQIEEFAKFNKSLEDSNVLVVLGYSFGTTDNHINAFVKEFYESKNNKQHNIVIIVCKNESEFNKQKENIGLKGSKLVYSVEYENNSNDEVIDLVFKKIKEKGSN